jgi:outer membrane receptor protein involved in Fe transport
MATVMGTRFIGLCAAGLVLLPAGGLAQESSPDLPVIRVTEGQSIEEASSTLASEPVERLSANPSVSLSRMSGRGLEPVIRGQSQERVDAAWKAENGFYIKGLVSRQEERDVKYAGSGMDAPKTDTGILRLEPGSPVANGNWNLLAWQADVDHIMDNFSLRESMMKMLTDSETETRGLRLTLDQSPDARTDWAVGADVESNNWHAERFGGANLDMLTSVLWPDVDRDRFGLFAERFYRVTPELKLGGGVRYDRVEMSAAAADKVFGSGMMAMSAADAYQTIYGTTNTDATDDNFSGFVSSDWRLPASHSRRVTFLPRVESTPPPGAFLWLIKNCAISTLDLTS